MFDYTKAHCFVVTAKKAASMGLRPNVPYGYYVVMTPKPPASTTPSDLFGLYSWCKTKTIAVEKAREHYESIIKGYHSCPCGAPKQQRGCCGVTAEQIQAATAKLETSLVGGHE